MKAGHGCFAGSRHKESVRLRGGLVDVELWKERELWVEAVHWLRTDAGGRVERYHLRSPSYHNWPAVALAAERAIVPNFPLVNKSFELCYSCTDR